MSLATRENRSLATLSLTASPMSHLRLGKLLTCTSDLLLTSRIVAGGVGWGVKTSLALDTGTTTQRYELFLALAHRHATLSDLLLTLAWGCSPTLRMLKLMMSK